MPYRHIKNISYKTVLVKVVRKASDVLNWIE
jgi:hypothetical protein